MSSPERPLVRVVHSLDDPCPRGLFLALGADAIPAGTVVREGCVATHASTDLLVVEHGASTPVSNQRLEVFDIELARLPAVEMPVACWRNGGNEVQTSTIPRTNLALNLGEP